MLRIPANPRGHLQTTSVAAVVVGAVLLSSLALHSGYPLLYSDTGTYLVSGYGDTVPWDRPMTYGLFLRAISFGRSPWTVVLAQSLALSWVLWCTIRRLTSVALPGLLHVFVVGGLAYTTAASVAASHLQPDVFSPASILCLGLLLFGQGLGRRERIALSLLFVLSNAVSMSHLATSSMLCLLAALSRLVKRPAVKCAVAARRLIWAAVALGLGWLAIPVAHQAAGAGFRYPQGGPIFFAGRLAESGVLADLLAEECATSKWRICALRDAIPPSADEFLWGDSPLTRAGGVTAENLREYREVVRTALTKPRWVARILAATVLATLRQLALFDSASWVAPYAEEGWVAVAQIRAHYPAAMNEFLRSRQRMGKLDLHPLDGRQYACVILTAGVVTLLLASRQLRRRLPNHVVAFTVYVLAALLLNAAVCGGLNTPAARYQNRVVFLIPLLAVLLLAHMPPRAMSCLAPHTSADDDVAQ